MWVYVFVLNKNKFNQILFEIISKYALLGSDGINKGRPKEKMRRTWVQRIG